MPSPAPDHPGLFIRDPYKFSDAMLIIPPTLVECLQCFDGRHTDLDLRAALVRLTRSLDVSAIEQNLVGTLSTAGFLRDECFEAMRTERRRAFAESAFREAAHAGSAYPGEPEAVRQTMTRYLGNETTSLPNDGLFAVAAPHVSPEGGWQSYAAAYRMLGPQYRDRTFVILGTSHYGESEKFGLTRKDFNTPLGQAASDRGLVDWLAQKGGDAVEMEDFCHSFEHTIEFQVLFLQHAVAPDVRIVPILCGSFSRSLQDGGMPEDHEGVKRFVEALEELNDREGDRLFWVLGVDMAHMGSRYGDSFRAAANEGFMNEVSVRDQARIERINASDAAGFWDLVRPNGDDLKWCGSSPFYTFLKAAPKARGELLQYEHWNIDEQSVVSFAGMAFSRG